MSLIDPINDQIHKLWAQVDLMPVMRWGVVTQTSPLMVALDGSIDTNGNPVSAPARSAVGPVSLGDRVMCLEQHLHVTIIATPQDDPTPDPVTHFAPSTFDITADAATWQTVGTHSPIGFGALPRPLMVKLNYNAVVGTTTAAAYAMIGVECYGGLALGPEIDQETGATQFGLTPFSNIPTAGAADYHTTITGSKTVTVPAGAATTFLLRCRRNTANGTQHVNYGKLTATPIKWAD